MVSVGYIGLLCKKKTFLKNGRSNTETRSVWTNHFHITTVGRLKAKHKETLDLHFNILWWTVWFQ